MIAMIMIMIKKLIIMTTEIMIIVTIKQWAVSVLEEKGKKIDLK